MLIPDKILLSGGETLHIGKLRSPRSRLDTPREFRSSTLAQQVFEVSNAIAQLLGTIWHIPT
jgi:hypothetical protein